jgi:hypothetical protein
MVDYLVMFNYCTSIRKSGRSRYLLSAAGFLLWPVSAGATQMHGGVEGLYIHQLAHLFFAFSMGMFIFWLRKLRLKDAAGWRCIQFAALFFIAWNLDAMASHWLLEQSGLVTIEYTAPLEVHFSVAGGRSWLIPLAYMTKLDHLLCVPAMVLLLKGLRSLLGDETSGGGSGDSAP